MLLIEQFMRKFETVGTGLKCLILKGNIDERRKTIFYKYMTIKRLKDKLDIYMEEIEKYKY